MKRLILFPFFLLFISNLNAQMSKILPDSMLVYTPEDKEIFNDYIIKFSDKKDLAIGNLLLKTGEFLLNTPYVNFTLEETAPAEKLIINLRELDCTTFTETALALSRTLKSDNQTFENYCKELCKIRYRGGEMNGFVSRLHYFSDWIYDNEQMGIVKNITKQAGGQPFNVTAYLMSKVSKNYRQLVADTTLIAPIKEIEEEITNRKHYFIPKTALKASKIQNGDILAMTTRGKGIEIMHMGLAVKRDGKVYFMHASSKEKRVMITEVPFVNYLRTLRSNTGFMIIRPVY